MSKAKQAKTRTKPSREPHAVVEMVDGNVIGVRTRTFKCHADALAATCAAENAGCEPKDLAAEIVRDGFWEDENGYRIQVVKIGKAED